MVQYLQTLLIDVTTFFFFSLAPPSALLSFHFPSMHPFWTLSFLELWGEFPPNAWMLGSEFEFQLNSSSKVRFLPYSFPPASEYSKMSVSISNVTVVKCLSDSNYQTCKIQILCSDCVFITHACSFWQMHGLPPTKFLLLEWCMTKRHCIFGSEDKPLYYSATHATHLTIMQV